MNNLKGELAVMDNLGIKSNYAALGRKYGMDWRTVKNIMKAMRASPLPETKAVNLMTTNRKYQTS